MRSFKAPQERARVGAGGVKFLRDERSDRAARKALPATPPPAQSAAGGAAVMGVKKKNLSSPTLGAELLAHERDKCLCCHQPPAKASHSKH